MRMTSLNDPVKVPELDPIVKAALVALLKNSPANVTLSVSPTSVTVNDSSVNGSKPRKPVAVPANV